VAGPEAAIVPSVPRGTFVQVLLYVQWYRTEGLNEAATTNWAWRNMRTFQKLVPRSYSRIVYLY